jgi:hypothetical protein
MKAHLTTHARKRSRQRLGLSTVAAENLANMALEKGTRHAETAGALKRYLDKLAMEHGGAKFRLYAEAVFIFQGTDEKASLVTVFALPNAHKATLRKIRGATRAHSMRREACE